MPHSSTQTSILPASVGEGLRYLSVFSGIGMHDLGFERAGWECVGQIEWDDYCQAVLSKHWPDVSKWKDVRDVSVDAVRERCGRVDLVTGGFACQDVSVAGRGAGLGKATRSGLTWRNLFRLIRGIRPAWIVIENVPALRSRGADRVLRVLERIGYACRPLVVGAEHVGAPHRRHRVWIVGNLADAAGDRRERRPVPVLKRRQEQADADAGRAGEGAPVVLANTGDARLAIGPVEHARHERPAVERSREAGRWPSRPGEPQHEWEHPRLAHAAHGSDERGQPRHGTGGDSEPGQPESPLGRAASRHAARLDGFARRNALKAYGNGNPPQCAELIARTVNRVIASSANSGGRAPTEGLAACEHQSHAVTERAPP